FSGWSRGSPLDAAFIHRQVHSECRTATLGALDPDMTTRLLDEAVDHRQSEAGALTDRLGGEERLQNPAESIVGHADTRITDTDHDVVAGFYLLLAEALVAVQDLTGRDNRQRT